MSSSKTLVPKHIKGDLYISESFVSYLSAHLWRGVAIMLVSRTVTWHINTDSQTDGQTDGRTARHQRKETRNKS